MYDFTGQECPVCKKKFTDKDDLVVCPDCGAPYHRTCYQENGQCVFTEKHGTGFEWTPPRSEKEVAGAVCGNCGTSCAAEDRFCRSCGAPLNQQPGTTAAPKGENTFDYSQLYNNTYTPPESTQQEQNPFEAELDPTSLVEGIPVADWAAYIGPSHHLYVMLFKQMELLQRKAAISFSAMVFGPFYFMYRKAWKPALIFTALMLLVDLPSMLYVLHLTESVVTAGMSADVLYRLSAAASVLNLAVMSIRGLYGFYLYKKSSLNAIQRIRQNYPDSQKRRYVLQAQGGTSWGAVFGLVAFWLLVCVVCAALAGPNLDALSALM